MPENEEFKNSSPHLQYIHAWHYDMLLNQERSQFYNDLIKENCRDKVVLEIGAGSGLLAVLAIKHGAKQVICCEENPLLAMAAQQLFRRLNLEDRIQLIVKNSKEIPTSDIPPVDVIVHELFGSDPFTEEMLPTLNDAQRFLKPGGLFLPDKIQIIYQAVQSQGLPEKLYFEDIELTEMSMLLSQIHPALRRRQESPIYSLPEVSIEEMLAQNYSYVEKNPALVGVDAVEVSFIIIHGKHRMQAAEFAPPVGRLHWHPLVFYKLDTASNELNFVVKDQVQLTVL